MHRLGLLTLIAACDSVGIRELPDAKPSPPSSGGCICTAIPSQSAICRSGMVTTDVHCYTATSTHNMCYEKYNGGSTTCAAGCTVEAELHLSFLSKPGEVQVFADKPQVLCAEAPEAQVGDPCDDNGAHPCLPTRAQLAADGTVASQQYLACSQGACATTTAPVIAGYLEACEAAIVTQYGTPGVNGGIANAWSSSACLLAWDAEAQVVKSGRTRACIGDWQCPTGSLCDRVQTLTPGTSVLAACKPGPRGTLTPAMLDQ